jgi:hypothetical protein
VKKIPVCLEARLVVLVQLWWVDGVRSVQKAGDGGQMHDLGGDSLDDGRAGGPQTEGSSPANAHSKISLNKRGGQKGRYGIERKAME